MPKPLVIVESPAKARTIAGFLGDAYNVESSVGHIRDLPSKGLSIAVDDHFTPTYEVHASKKDVIRRLKALLKDVDELYLATDEDRDRKPMVLGPCSGVDDVRRVAAAGDRQDGVPGARELLQLVAHGILEAEVVGPC